MDAKRRRGFTVFSANNRRGGDRFNPNQPRDLFADGEARVADLTDEIRLAGDEPDDLILAEAQFTQPVLDFGRGAQLFDAHGYAGLHAVQRAKFATRFSAEACLKIQG